jgi:hypothetical protein
MVAKGNGRQRFLVECAEFKMICPESVLGRRTLALPLLLKIGSS